MLEDLERVEGDVAEGGLASDNRFPAAVVGEGECLLPVAEVLQRLKDDVLVVDGDDAAAVTRPKRFS